MSTISDKSIIRTILENDGIYPGDPQLYAVYSYIGLSNSMSKDERLYAVFMTKRSIDIYDSPYVIDPKLLWNKQIGLTREGEDFLGTER